MADEPDNYNVVDFTGITRLDIDPDRVLRKAIGQLERCTIVGVNKDGDEFFASSVADGGTVVWDMERAKHKLMKIVDEAVG